MKKQLIIYFLITFLFILILIVSNYKLKSSKKSNYHKITIAEVTHSAFYAPLYVAIENGYFKNEGIEIELILTPGADKVSAAILSKDAQIGLAGAESAIYIYNGEEKDYLQLFCSLTRIDGQFIVSRKKEENFSLENLKGKEILVGRSGGMPSINFLTALYNNNINPNEININYSIDFASLAGSFISGIGDYVNLFEPTATKLVKEGHGYIVGSIGLLSNEVPYTAFYSKKSFINDNKELISKFNSSIQKGIDYVYNNNSKDIAKLIQSQFNDLSLNELTLIIDNYKNINSWYKNTEITETSLENLNNMLIKNNLISKKVPYEKLVYKK